MIRQTQTSRQDGERGMELVPASQFSMAELTEAYNQARADYLVPMAMDADRLAAYIQLYDVDLDRSWVAVDGAEILGLAMLGVRAGRTWLTRLGVLPHHRRHGTGEALVRALLATTQELGCRVSVLEVIQGNRAAHELFLKAGFRETRELLILRRPPGISPHKVPGRAAWLAREEAVERVRGYSARQPWTNEVETYQNAGDVQGWRL